VLGKPGRKARAAAFGAVAVGMCAVLAACSPVKVGSAAIVGDQRITVSSLDTQVTNLQAEAKPYGSQVTLTAAEMPAAVLSWLIRFQISDQTTANEGISVSQAQIQAGLASINSQVAQVAQSDSVSSQAVLVNVGITQQMLPDLGMFQAQETAFAQKDNGGKLPTTQAESNTVNAALTKAQCSAAKSLNIQVNPQFGRLDYSQYTVVPVANTLSRPPGTPSPADTTGLAPAC
jgi:SurA N-terminal domain